MAGSYHTAVERLVVVVNGRKYVPAENALALADHVDALNEHASDLSWDLERLREYDRDNFVADGQWT